MSDTRPSSKPLALVVFLENVGHLHGVALPRWTMAVIDFVAEEYAKLVLRWHGVHHLYPRVIFLEDERANGSDLAATLIAASRTHRVDVLILAHGLPGRVTGFRGEQQVGEETFGRLRSAFTRQPDLLDLRMVWQMNCFGASLVSSWRDLGAQVVNGSIGVNWLPEPALSLFLRAWLNGRPYSQAVVGSTQRAEKVWSLFYRRSDDGCKHPRLVSSGQVIAGTSDITIYGG
jgi:hypothetical protein